MHSRLLPADMDIKHFSQKHKLALCDCEQSILLRLVLVENRGADFNCTHHALLGIELVGACLDGWQVPCY